MESLSCEPNHYYFCDFNSFLAVVTVTSLLAARSPPSLPEIARVKRSLAPGAAIKVTTLFAPADTPAVVTLFGSPPKAAIFWLTQRNAAIWSSRPALPESLNSSPSNGAKFRKPNALRR
jgi:hypothetical protein